jgi:NAD(P)-dependent dehydrogenase (short-subunit alcohol dehydrogenase family)
MERIVMVSDADTPLGRELVRLFTARGHQVAALVSDARASEFPGTGSRAPLVVPWSRRSPAGARTAVLSTLNRFGVLEEAVVLGAAPSPPALPHELASVDIERAVDQGLKGPIFLVRELLGVFLRRGQGVLSLVCFSERRDDEPGPALDQTVQEGWQGFAAGVLDAYAEKSVFINGFKAAGVGHEEAAAFVDRSLEEKARKITGRWFTFQPRGGILGRR